MKEQSRDEEEILPPAIDGQIASVLISKIAEIDKTTKLVSVQVRNLPDKEEAMAEVKNCIIDLEKKIESTTYKQGQIMDAIRTSRETMTEGFTEIRQAPTDLKKSIQDLHTALEQHTALFEKPAKKEVHHRHFLSRPLLTLCCMMLIIFFMSFLFIREKQRSDQYKDNDIKWRYVKLCRDTLITGALNKIERNFQSEPEKLREEVYKEEEKRAMLYDKQQEINQKQQEIDDLEKR